MACGFLTLRNRPCKGRIPEPRVTKRTLGNVGPSPPTPQRGFIPECGAHSKGCRGNGKRHVTNGTVIRDGPVGRFDVSMDGSRVSVCNPVGVDICMCCVSQGAAARYPGLWYSTLTGSVVGGLCTHMPSGCFLGTHRTVRFLTGKRQNLINPGGGVCGSKLTFSSSDLSTSVSLVLVLSIAVLVLVLDLCR
jgi:hypothetical protein